MHEIPNDPQRTPWQVSNESTEFPRTCANVDKVGQVGLVFITL